MSKTQKIAEMMAAADCTAEQAEDFLECAFWDLVAALDAFFA